MSSLKEMSDEYLRNAADMENRIRELESQLKHTIRLESQRKLRWSMAQVLTPKQYQIFALCFLEGMPQKTIAAELGLSVSSVSKIYTSALKKLRRLWNA